MFLSADGESGKPGGNETIRVDGHGQLRVQVPSAFVGELGSHLPIGAPLRFSHRGGEWWARVAARRAVRYDLSYDPGRGRWYLDGSWKTCPNRCPHSRNGAPGGCWGWISTTATWRAGVLDGSGNPIGAPVSIEVGTAGLRASRRDGRVRAALTDLLDHAQQHHCSRGGGGEPSTSPTRAPPAGKPWAADHAPSGCAAPVAGIPAARFRTRLTGMASRRGIAVIGVDPGLHQPLGCSTLARTPPTADLRTGSPGTMARRPRSGDVASDWRSGGGRQDPAPDSGPLRSRHRPGPNISRAHNGGAAAPAHRHAHHEASRSTGKHPPPAANTVRAAQDSLLLTNTSRASPHPDAHAGLVSLWGLRSGRDEDPGRIVSIGCMNRRTRLVGRCRPPVRTGAQHDRTAQCR